MTKTTYYNLTKPDANEYYNINVFNSNANIIDAALHTQQSSISSETTRATNAETALGTRISNITPSSIGTYTDDEIDALLANKYTKVTNAQIDALFA